MAFSVYFVKSLTNTSFGSFFNYVESVYGELGSNPFQEFELS